MKKKVIMSAVVNNVLKSSRMNEMVIDDGVPIPSVSGRGKKSVWPFNKLTEVGQSFGFDHDKMQAVRAAATYYMKNNPEVRLTIRKLENEGRCWRTE